MVSELLNGISRIAAQVCKTSCASTLLVSWLVGCGHLTPYSEIRQSLPTSELVRIDDQWIHSESMGDGESIVLLHGFGGSTYSWRETLPRLAEQGYRAVAIDLNGFGYTQRPQRDEAYSVAGQKGLVLRVMDALSIERAHLVGHSYGAGIALQIACEHPERIKTLTLVDGGGAGGGGPTIPDVLKPFILCWVKNFALREDNIRDILQGAVHRKEIITDQVVNAYLDRLRVEGLDDAFYGLATRSAPVPPVDVTRLSTPTQILWGAHDSVIPIRVGESLAKQIPGTSFIRFEESGHLPMEEQPELFADTLRDFLDGHP